VTGAATEAIAGANAAGFRMQHHGLIEAVLWGTP
jgi:hypothetical protein